MNKNKDKLTNREFIQSLFDEDGIRAPESLSKDKIMDIISSEGSDADRSSEPSTAVSAVMAREKVRPRKKHRALKWIAIAACAVIAVAGLPELYYSSLFMPDTSVRDGELHTFRSKGEIKHIIDSMNRLGFFDRFRMRSGRLYGRGDDLEYMTEDAVATEEAATGATQSGPAAINSFNGKSSSGSDSPDHSSTYLQVADVDEADIVKVDGRYIYAVNNKREVIIYEADNGKAKRLSVIGSNGIENYVENIFLKGDTLVTVGKVYDANENGYASVVTYDISDRSNPRIINDFRQSGDSIVASRMVGDYVYLVTIMYTYGNYIIPYCTIDGTYKEMPCSDISCAPNPENSSYIVLSAVDIASGAEGRSKSKAVMGATDEIYCNNHNLYVSIGRWSSASSSRETRIIRAALDGLKIKFNGTATVKGYVLNQFSMDEHDGYFRIATTSDRSGMNVNNLYVLDDKLKEVGKISGFARDESIKAVRFMGEKAYVITYEAIDPLFVMDLSDPVNPHIEGEVKIDGFSSLLIPASPGRILGIGHATGDNGYGGQYASGLKLALFDTSDPSEPKVLDSREFENMESPAQSTHLALTVNNSAGYYAIPYTIWNYETEIIEDAEVASDDNGNEVAEEEISDEYEFKNDTGVLVFGLGGDNNDKIDVYDQHRMDAVQVLRSAYIGDYIYGIDGMAEVYGFKFNK